MRTQSIEDMNKCKVAQTVDEDIGDTNCNVAFSLHTWHANTTAVISAIPGQNMNPE
jgi:hypothetical protein